MTATWVDAAEHRRVRAVRMRVPWSTVLPLAVVTAYADLFWVVAMRGAVASTERADAPFVTWLRESLLLLPVYVFAVLAALTLALRWFGPHPLRARTTAVTLLLVSVAATVAGVAVLAANGAYDYQMQIAHLDQMTAMRGTCGPGCLDDRQQATLLLQVRAVGLGSALLLLSNLVLVALVAAFRGGHVELAASRQRVDRLARLRQVARRDAAGPASSTAQERWLGNGVDDLRMLLATALLATAVIHTLLPPYPGDWAGAGTFVTILCVAEIAVSVHIIARPKPTVFLAAAAVSATALLLWGYSRTLGMPFGPDAGVPEPIGLPDTAAALLTAAALVAALTLARAGEWLRRTSPAQHLSQLALVAVLAVTVVGIGPGLDGFGGAEPVSGQSVNHGHG
jgi:hypothetical protein